MPLLGKTAVFLHINAISREYLMAYYIPIPYSPFENFLLLLLRGSGSHCALSYASDSGAARICQRGGGS